MKKKLSIACATALLFALMNPCAALAGEYVIDSGHSTVIYRTLHKNLSFFYGAFSIVRGDITFDPDNPSACKVEVEVPYEGIESFNQGRDDALLGAKFFNIAKFGEMTFKSKEWKKTGDKTYAVTGGFTLLGITKPITAKVVYVGSGPRPSNPPADVGFEITFTLKKSDFGMGNASDKRADEVNIMMGVEANKK